MVLFSVAGFYGGDGGVQDAFKLVCFIDERVQIFRVLDEGDLLNELEPTVGFAEFFESDFEFMDKVGVRFSGLCFCVIGHGRCAGAEDLRSNVLLRK